MTIFFEVDFCNGKVAGAAWAERRGIVRRSEGMGAAAWRGETARNSMPRGAKGEIDLGGYDGEKLVFIEVRMRTACGDQAALPELSGTAEKQVGRTPAFF